MTSLTVADGVLLTQGLTVIVPIDVTMMNVAEEAGSVVPPASEMQDNYVLYLFLSDVDVALGSYDWLHLPRVQSDTTDSQSQMSLSPGSTVVIHGDFNVNVNAEVCAQVHFLCVQVEPGTGTYIDREMNNNVICMDVSDSMTCKPGNIFFQYYQTAHPQNSTLSYHACVSDLQVASLTVTTSGIVFKELLTTQIHVSVEVLNSGTSLPGNDIIPVTSPRKNYLISFQVTDGDLVSQADTLSMDLLFFLADDEQQLKAGLPTGSTLTIQGEVNVTSAVGLQCPSTAYLCVSVVQDISASFIDVDDTNNIICTDISAKVQCRPGR